jgi:hypothetical protein
MREILEKVLTQKAARSAGDEALIAAAQSEFLTWD